MATPEQQSRQGPGMTMLVSIAIPVYNTARFLPAAEGAERTGQQQARL